MCLTAHFIDKDWKLHKKILNFCVISSHKGESIGRAVEECLVDWGIKKVCTLTVDNASSNDTAIAFLKRKFAKKSYSFVLGGKHFHMRCVAHILNLIVRDGLTELNGAITKVRAAVKYVRSSPQRQKLFKACAEKEGIESDSLLSLDVPTRWNSTFLMLDTAIKFQKAFDRLDEEDDKFSKEFDELELDGPPSPMDWNDCMLITRFLKKFYDATNRLSAYLHVSSNLYFTEVCDIVGSLNELSMMEDSSLRSMSIKMRLKFDKYWEPIDKMNMMLLVAVVLDPRYKLKYVKFCYSYYFKLEVSHMIELTQKLRNALNGVYEEYKQYGSASASSSSLTCEWRLANQVCKHVTLHQCLRNIWKKKNVKEISQKWTHIWRKLVKRYMEIQSLKF